MAHSQVYTPIPGLLAGEDLSAGQYKVVKFASTAGEVVAVTATTSVALGILQNDPQTGNPQMSLARARLPRPLLARLTSLKANPLGSTRPGRSLTTPRTTAALLRRLWKPRPQLAITSQSSCWAYHGTREIRNEFTFN